MLSCVSGFLPTNECKYSIFFTINAPLEYYFFGYKEKETFSEGKKKSLDFIFALYLSISSTTIDEATMISATSPATFNTLKNLLI